MANRDQNIQTPVEFVRAVEECLGIKFSYDMAGTEDNKKAPNVFTEEQNSLQIGWPKDGWCWLNPPFKNVGKWAEKCLEQKIRGCRIVSIWPLSGDLNMILAWEIASIYIIHGRVWPEVRGCMLCVWNAYDTQRPPLGVLWDKKRSELIKTWG